MQNSISKLDLIQQTINSKIGILKQQDSYTVEVTLDTSKLDEILIIGSPFLTKFENGSQTLACIELDANGKRPDQITLVVRSDSNQLIHPEDGINIWFRRLVQSPRGNNVCWERRPAYLEDLEEMDSNTITIIDAIELHEIAFGY